MKAVLILSLIAITALAQASDPVYITDLRPRTQAGKMSRDELRSTRDDADQYAKVSGLVPLQEGLRDEVRFWLTWATFDPSTNGIATVGYVIAGDDWQVCRIGYSGKSTVPDSGQCRRYGPRATRERMAGDLRRLAALADFSIECGIQDGEWVTIDAVAQGKRFSLSAGNPVSCAGDASQFVGRFLDRVRVP